MASARGLPHTRCCGGYSHSFCKTGAPHRQTIRTPGGLDACQVLDMTPGIQSCQNPKGQTCGCEGGPGALRERWAWGQDAGHSPLGDTGLRHHRGSSVRGGGAVAPAGGLMLGDSGHGGWAELTDTQQPGGKTPAGDFGHKVMHVP